jgi:hypothetical protein
MQDGRRGGLWLSTRDVLQGRARSCGSCPTCQSNPRRAPRVQKARFEESETFCPNQRLIKIRSASGRFDDAGLLP